MTEIRGPKSDRQRILPGEIPAPVDNILPPDRKSAGAADQIGLSPDALEIKRPNGGVAETAGAVAHERSILAKEIAPVGYNAGAPRRQFELAWGQAEKDLVTFLRN